MTCTPQLATPVTERPVVAFRVGVTGSTSLDNKARALLRSRVDHLLADICWNLRGCAASPEVSDVHGPGLPLLRVISPLGEGADRLVARAALDLEARTPDLGCRVELDVLLPFAQAEYESTFSSKAPERQAASQACFRSLLSAAGPRVLTLDGTRGDDRLRHQSYAAVGQLVVRNSDLLIAIWDEHEVPRGPGGTHDTVHYALRAGVPVWLIHSGGERDPRWIDDELDLLGPASETMAGLCPSSRLASYIVAAIVPPAAERSAHQSRSARAMHWLRVRVGVEDDPLRRFLAETLTPNRRIWRAHPAALGVLREWGRHRYLGKTDGGARAGSAWRVGAARLGQGLAWVVLMRMFGRDAMRTASSTAASLSENFQHLYRSSYLLVFILSAVALVLPAIGLKFEGLEITSSIFEFGFLLVIGSLVFCNQSLLWHERYINYRELAELLRLSRPLHGVGWSLPGARVSQLAGVTKDEWVPWYFAALVRATPLPRGTLGPAELRSIRETFMTLLDKQEDFHRRRKEECIGASAILESCGRWLFALTLVLVFLKLVLITVDMGEKSWPFLSLVGGVLIPALSAAFFGLRTYEELEMLSEQSERMERAGATDVACARRSLATCSL